MNELSKEAEKRLAILEEHQEKAASIRAQVVALQSEIDDCGWDSILGTIEDTEGALKEAIEGIHAWDQDLHKERDEDFADFKRRLREEA